LSGASQRCQKVQKSCDLLRGSRHLQNMKTSGARLSSQE
jgi:hypothetical protein